MEPSSRTAGGTFRVEACQGMARPVRRGQALGDADADAVADWLLVTADEAPPSWVVNRAVRIAGQARSQEVPRPAAWRRLVAALVHDTRPQPRPPGAPA